MSAGDQELRFTIGDIRRIDHVVEVDGVDALTRSDREIHQLVFPVLREMAPRGEIEALLEILERRPPEISGQFEGWTLSQIASWWTLLIRDELFSPAREDPSTDDG